MGDVALTGSFSEPIAVSLNGPIPIVTNGSWARIRPGGSNSTDRGGYVNLEAWLLRLPQIIAEAATVAASA